MSVKQIRPMRRSALISPWGVGAIVPFVNDFPTDTELYKLMSTKPGEG